MYASFDFQYDAGDQKWKLVLAWRPKEDDYERERCLTVLLPVDSNGFDFLGTVRRMVQTMSDDYAQRQEQELRQREPVAEPAGTGQTPDGPQQG